MQAGLTFVLATVALFVAESDNIRVMKNKLKQLKGVFVPSDRLLIIINPDPDSIASALALKRICRSWVSGVTIARYNPITRPENKTMLRLLKIRLGDFNRMNPQEYSKTAIVDNQPTHFAGESLPPIDIIIDHHVSDQGYKAAFKDIRPQYGATSTIMAEYLEEAKIKPSPKLATALCYGIKTDTNNFQRDVIRKDASAFGRLFALARPQILMNIEKWEIPREGVDVFKRALGSYVVREGILSVFLGKLENPDIAVMVADFLNSIQGVYICAVSAVRGGSLMVILRESGLKCNVGHLAVAAFNDIGEGGGHRSAARAEIELTNIGQDVNLRNGAEVRDFIYEKLSRARAALRKSKTNRTRSLKER